MTSSQARNLEAVLALLRGSEEERRAWAEHEASRAEERLRIARKRWTANKRRNGGLYNPDEAGR